MARIVLIYSGGLDSTVLLYDLIKQGHEVKCIAFNYGQRHKKELLAARENATVQDCYFREIDLSNLREFLTGSSQTDTSVPVPEGHYTDESMKQTVVPNRNMIMLSIATGIAIGMKADLVAYAAHSGDHAIYPDCRPAFFDSLGYSIELCDWHPPKLHAPFLHKSKADIVKLGDELLVPFAKTWSCYKGGEKQCKKCGTCVERREAFELAGVPDPTEYE